MTRLALWLASQLLSISLLEDHHPTLAYNDSLSSTPKAQLHFYKYPRPAGPEGIKHRSESLTQVVAPSLHLVPLYRLELCPHRGLSTCYSVVTNLFSGRTDIFLFLCPLRAFLCQDIPIVSLPKKESKRTSVVFSFILVFGLATSKTKIKGVGYFWFFLFHRCGNYAMEKNRFFSSICETVTEIGHELIHKETSINSKNQ